MKYDFTTLVDRTGTGSCKWDGMTGKKPTAAKGTVPFTVADMEFKNAPEIGEAIGEYAKNNILGYTAPTAHYYEAVAGWMKRIHRFDVKREEIVVYPGVVPALFHLVRALCQKGDGVIVMPPIYPPFFGAVESFGCKQLLCPLINEEEKYTLDFDLLEKQCREPSTKLLLFCSPHNPVGRVWSREELTRAAKICTENNVVIVSDEIHFDIIMPGSEQVSMGCLEEFSDNIILCTAPSKTFNLASMQTANVIIKNPGLREKFLRMKDDMQVESLNVLGFVACETAYNKCEGWMREMIGTVYENYLYIKEFIEKNLPKLKIAPMEGTYLAWVNCRGLGLNPEELETRLIDRDIFVNGGAMFGDSGKGYVRIDLACPKSVIVSLMERFAEAVS